MNPEPSMSSIERVVMRRVSIVHALRPVFSGGTLALLIAVLALYGIGREVWVARVFQNAPHNAISLPQFYLYAFEHTRLIVQALSLAALGAVIYLAKEAAKLGTGFLIPERA